VAGQDPLDDAKRDAAVAAVSAHVTSGTAIGLGSGSTASHVVRELGRVLAAGTLRDVVGVPTSERTATLARQVGVPLTTLADHPRLVVALDGADEVAPGLALIKGLGGALLREKVVASAAERFIVVADHTKEVDRLGARAPVPVEVIVFAERVCALGLEALGAQPTLRRTADGAPFVTDEGNHILDCRFDRIDDPERLDHALHGVAGVVEHGLFLGRAAEAFLAGPDGVRRLGSAGG
jgi:ribose 5-phosphate isomerase A